MTELDPKHKLPFQKALEYAIEKLKHDLPCCPNCEWWTESRELCTLGNANVRPPAPVIAFGCGQFEAMIPF
jgi:hypothetical protein